MSLMSRRPRRCAPTWRPLLSARGAGARAADRGAWCVADRAQARTALRRLRARLPRPAGLAVTSRGPETAAKQPGGAIASEEENIERGEQLNTFCVQPPLVPSPATGTTSRRRDAHDAGWLASAASLVAPGCAPGHVVKRDDFCRVTTAFANDDGARARGVRTEMCRARAAGCAGGVL